MPLTKKGVDRGQHIRPLSSNLVNTENLPESYTMSHQITGTDPSLRYGASQQTGYTRSLGVGQQAARTPKQQQPPPHATDPTVVSERQVAIRQVGVQPAEWCPRCGMAVEEQEYPATQGEQALPENSFSTNDETEATKARDERDNRARNEPLAYGHDNRLGGKDRTTGHSQQPYGDAFTTSNTSRHTGDSKRYRTERDNIEEQLRQVQAKNREYEAIIRKLEADVGKAQDKVDRTKRSAHQMQTTLDNKELFLGPQSSDDEVKARFSALLTSIKTWSINFSGQGASKFALESLPAYQRVAPLSSQIEYLEKTITTSKKQKRLFVRGWVAFIMSHHLFRTLDLMGDMGSDLWLENAFAQNFACLENRLWLADRKTISYRAFNDWRAFTVELFTKLDAPPGPLTRHPQANAAIDEAADAVFSIVEPWCNTNDSNVINDYKERLCDIFADAVRFAQFLRRQRALWSIKFPTRQKLAQHFREGTIDF
ncbi:hypothetical protein N0V90_009163 [Kalmusia sp. IMI 367209]|nr:hypothetical protein N0V90_009163 [Kalmusia sp. IMI 367209]